MICDYENILFLPGAFKRKIRKMDEIHASAWVRLNTSTWIRIQFNSGPGKYELCHFQ